MNKLKKVIRKDILNFKEYKTVSSVWDLAAKFKKQEKEIIKLDQGENFYGTSPKVQKILGDYKFYNYYPDPEYKALRKAIAKEYKVPSEKVMVGSGSDELIDLIFRLVLNVGDKVINFPPTFGMYEVSIALNRGEVINIPRDEKFSINVRSALKAIDNKTKIIIVCSPNNPTGGIVSRQDIIKLLKTGKLVLLDEAYAEYSQESNLDLVSKYSNLIVLRTFSKWAGIAGLRLGFLVMDEYLISQLMKIKPPFNVNLAAQSAGLTILEDLKFAQENIIKLKAERERFTKELRKILYLEVFDSQTNFIFVQAKVADFPKLQDYLLSKQIILRYFISDLTGNGIRITVGSKKTNNQVIKAFQEYKPNSLTYDGIIFDMDGVLIDVSNSYRIAIRDTVNFFLKQRKKITLKEVNAIKKISGFNDDWDASYRLYDLISRGIRIDKYIKYAKPLTDSERSTKLYKQIKDVFQSLYLGDIEFEKSEKRKAPLKVNTPLRLKEELIISKKLLKKFKEQGKLVGIATGRPRSEALFALKQFGISEFFSKQFLIAQEDVKNGKPSPEILIKSKRIMGIKNPIYIGDTINDYESAKRAKVPFIFVGEEKIGEYQVKKTDEIGGILNVA